MPDRVKAYTQKEKRKKSRVVKRGIMCCVYYNMHAHYLNVEKQCVLLDRLIVYIIYMCAPSTVPKLSLYTFWVSGYVYLHSISPSISACNHRHIYCAVYVPNGW